MSLNCQISLDLAARLDAYIASVQRQYPGMLLKRASVIRQALEAFLAANAAR